MSKNKPETTSSRLLASGKSSRLLEMRNKSRSPDETAVATDSKSMPFFREDDEPGRQLRLVQTIIDQHLASILAGLPVGRQRSLFKIRYGCEPEALKQLPIKHIIKRLQIQHPMLQAAHGEMKRILELTYNGQPAA